MSIFAVSSQYRNSCVISGFSGPIFTKIVQNVAKIVPLTSVNRNCDIRIQNWLPWQRSLRNREKMSGSRKFTQIPFISWKDRENRSSRSWDNLAASKIYSPVGKCAERAKKVKLKEADSSLCYNHRTCVPYGITELPATRQRQHSRP